MTVALLKDGMTIGKAKVIVDIVPKGNYEIRPGYPMNPTEIATHNTGNDGKGANAKAHNKYIHNMANLKPKDTGYASWHFSVDEDFIIQHIPMNESAWHTGDGSGANSGNRNAIGIEICEHRDQKNYHQAEENAIALTVHLMELQKIAVMKVRPHQSYSGKFCPRVILGRDKSFTPYLNRVRAAMGKPVADQGEVKPLDVKKLQADLNKVGGYKLVVDGKLGAKTTAAIKDFQRTQKLTIDGIAGPKTLAALAAALKPKPVVKEATKRKGLYKVQVGAFAEKDNAEKLVKALEKAGFKAGFFFDAD